ncbi:hypothetical protein AK830_g11815 [Neonectria ditissima]|uniref:Uncharacterized protein n=1 Tax=Neonectria ditissima TaxID=78410 RepID=A0A0P7B273_9HYPO|nr:hypothetical protein AK830_g11815 [Neonectria ditissima]
MDVDSPNGIESPQPPPQSPPQSSGRLPSHPNHSPRGRLRRQLPTHPRLTRSRLRQGLIGSGRRVSSIQASIQEVLHIDEGGHRAADDILRGIGGFSESDSLRTAARQRAALENDIAQLHRDSEDRKRRRLEEQRRRKRAKNGPANPAPPPQSPKSPQLPDRRLARDAKP